MFRIGTRGSKLALTQAAAAAELLGQPYELVTFETSGDRGEKLLDKVRWVDRLDQALLDKEIDLAIHSAKDVPTELNAAFRYQQLGERLNPQDLLIGVSDILELPKNARVGTSSIRRRAQLLAYRDDLKILDLHGNVDTRLRKLADGEFDAIILAAAGLERLAVKPTAATLLSPDLCTPAPGQGSILVQYLAETTEILKLLPQPTIGDRILKLERKLMRLLNADCHSPVGFYLRPLDQTTLTYDFFAASEDLSDWLRDRGTNNLDLDDQVILQKIYDHYTLFEAGIIQ